MARPKIGQRYLTVSGLPVQVIGMDERGLLLQSLASDNRFPVPASYPLRPYRGEESVYQTRANPYGQRADGALRLANSAAIQPLAPLIDAMLLAGNMTMRGIVRELQRKASAACHGRDLRANVRARLYWFRRKGRSVRRDDQGRVQVWQAA